eukprot:m.32773 g.32773  ORF g.32773 m.32773 type:complete len:77 (+) comp15055_c0_seq1:57-287(+)
MHPNLSPHLHNECKEAIAALEKCHLAHPMGKFAGYCNTFYQEMHNCLRQEFEKKRQKDNAAARKRKAETKRILEEP